MAIDLAILSVDEIEGLVERILAEYSRRLEAAESSSAELDHLNSQFKTRYMFLVGHWAGSPKAKSTRTGKFVANDDVIRFLTS